MVAFNKRLLSLCILLLFTVTARAQNVSEQYCKYIEDSVIKKLNPTKMNRREVYSTECVFEFTVTDDIDVTLRIEKHGTEAEGHKSLEGTLALTALYLGLESKEELRFDRLDTGNSWDEVYFNKATKMNSGSLLLRKGNTTIEMLSLKDEILIRMEQLLRDEIGCEKPSTMPINN